MKKFIFAKIGSGNSLAGRYLSGNSEVNFPAVPIYFDCNYDNEEQFLKDGGAKGQGELFFECGRHPDEKYIVVIHEGNVHILRPSGSVQFKKSSVLEDKDGYVKLLPVEILKKMPISEVPVILASIGANRYYSSGTFREISDVGNIRAIQMVLGLNIAVPDSPTIIHAIECISSIEFETLVAKIFEEAGFFVPAYRGGTMPGADLFVYNKLTAPISIGGLSVASGARKSIQVKLPVHATLPPQGIDYLVACNVPESSSVFGAEWLAIALAKSPRTKEWLKTSLEWLPPYFIKETCGAL